MGLDSRDYARPDSDGYSPSFGGGGSYSGAPDASVCRWIIVATVIVFLLQIFSTRDMTPEEAQTVRDQYREQLERSIGPLADAEGPDRDEFLETRIQYMPVPRVCVVQEWLELDTSKVMSGQIWRLVTNAFCHDRESIFHILFNMLFLWWFGPAMESMFGRREFLWFYLTAAVASSLAYVGLDLVTGDPRPAIGASGAVMAVTSLYALYYPSHRILVFFILPVEVRWLVLFYAVISIHPILLALSGEDVLLYDNVAHAAHLGGLVFGYLYGKQHWRLSDLPRRLGLGGSRGSSSGSRRKTIPISRDVATAARVDEILQKIHESGEDSLTDEERRFLAKESDRMKKRRQ